MSTPVRNRKPTKRALESTSPIIANQLKKKRPPIGSTSPGKSTPPSTPPKPTSSALSAALLTTPPTAPITPVAVPVTVIHPAAIQTTPPKLSGVIPIVTPVAPAVNPILAEVSRAQNDSPSPVPSENEVKETKTVIFKDPNFRQQSKGSSSGRRNRLGKNLKQVINSERSLPWKPTDVTYGSIDAPPSFLPAKKYSDITGLPAKYTDPHSKIRYATTEEFARIRILPSDIVSGYLALRKATGPVS